MTKMGFKNDSNYSEFGGKNKARRLAKLIAKGKTEKAQKLAGKIQDKVTKLEAKGKIDSKRYSFLTGKLAASGLMALSEAEQDELGLMQDQIEEGDDELKSGIDSLSDDDGDNTKKIIIYGAIGLLVAGGIIVTIVLLTRKKGKK